jgi:hypothetical protein
MNGILFKKRIFTAHTSASNMEVFVPDIDSNGLIVTIPAGYMLEFIVFDETGGSDVTVDIGTTAGDDDIIADYLIESGETDTLSINTVYSMSSTQTIYISSSSWGTSSLDIYVLMRKI